MRGKANTTVPALTIAAILFGLATPAFADVPPRERKTRTVEGQHAPPIAPPVETAPPPEEAPPPEPAPEPAVQPTPAATPAPEAKPEAKTEAKAATDSKSSTCSINVEAEQTIAGFAALMMFIAGSVLLRRKR